jgi:hypothetical protein
MANNKQFAGLFDEKGNRSFTPAIALSAAGTLSAKTLNDQLTTFVKDHPDKAQGIARLGGLGDNAQLTPDQINAVSSVLATKIAALSQKQSVDGLTAQGDAAFETVSTELRNTLTAGNDTLEKSGLHFKPEDLALIAHQLTPEVMSGIKVSTPVPQAFKEAGEKELEIKANGVAVDELVKTLSENGELRKGVAQLSGKPDLDQSDLLRIATVVAPTLVKMNSEEKKKELASDPDNAYAIVANDLNAALQNNATTINQNGVKLSSESLKLLANKSAAIIVPKLKIDGVKDTPPTELVQATEQAKQQSIRQLTNSTITSMANESIMDGTMLTAVAGYRDNWGFGFTRTWASKCPPGMGDKADVVDKYYSHSEKGYKAENYSPNGTPDPGELKQTREAINDYLGSVGYALNSNQRDVVARGIASAVTEVTSDPKNAELLKPENRGALADAVQQRVISTLNANKSAVDYYGTSVDTINANTELNLFDTVASKIGDKIRSDNGVYSQLTTVMQNMKESRDTVAKAQADDVKSHADSSSTVPLAPKPAVSADLAR